MMMNESFRMSSLRGMLSLSPRRGAYWSKIQDMVVDAPWWRVGIDLTGRHPLSRIGNYCILTYLDHFTKLSEDYPIPNKKVDTIWRVLVGESFPRFGVPIQILTDQGRQFNNRLMKGLSEVYRMD